MQLLYISAGLSIIGSSSIIYAIYPLRCLPQRIKCGSFGSAGTSEGASPGSGSSGSGSGSENGTGNCRTRRPSPRGVHEYDSFEGRRQRSWKQPARRLLYWLSFADLGTALVYMLPGDANDKSNLCRFQVDA